MVWLAIAVLMVSFSLPITSAIPLYPFGAEQGDQLLFPNDDGSTEALNLTVSFPFFGRDYNTIFVSCICSSYLSCLPNIYNRIVC